MAEKTTDLSHESLHVGSFYVGEEEFAVEILKIQEIIHIMEITKVPRASDLIEGAINLRGTIIPLINLRTRFGMEARPFDNHTRIINIEVHDMVIGLIVDSIGKVFKIPMSQVEPSPAVVASVDSEYISGVGKLDDHLLIILNVDKLCSTDTLVELSGIASEVWG